MTTYFEIRKRGIESHAPVDETIGPVEGPLFMEATERFDDSLREVLKGA